MPQRILDHFHICATSLQQRCLASAECMPSHNLAVPHRLTAGSTCLSRTVSGQYGLVPPFDGLANTQSSGPLIMLNKQLNSDRRLNPLRILFYWVPAENIAPA